MLDHFERRAFLRLTVLVEGGVIVLALGLAWLLGVKPWESFAWDLTALAWGVGATFPLAALYWAAYRWPFPAMRRIKTFLLDALGPSLAACRWYELLFVAALAGLSEELLFRGVLQLWMERFGYLPSLLGSNLLFGLCHAISISYALIATGMGLVLGLLLDAPGQRNLLTPIVTHGLYDYWAFCFIAREWRARQRLANQESSSNDHSAASQEV